MKHSSTNTKKSKVTNVIKLIKRVFKKNQILYCWPSLERTLGGRNLLNTMNAKTQSQNQKTTNNNCMQNQNYFQYVVEFPIYET